MTVPSTGKIHTYMLPDQVPEAADKQPLYDSDPNMPFERAPSFNWVGVVLVNFIFIFYFNMGGWLQY